MTPIQRAKTLISDRGLSRHNKIWLATGWGIEWRWKNGRKPLSNGAMKDPIEYLIDGKWWVGTSFDEWHESNEWTKSNRAFDD